MECDKCNDREYKIYDEKLKLCYECYKSYKPVQLAYYKISDGVKTEHELTLDVRSKHAYVGSTPLKSVFDIIMRTELDPSATYEFPYDGQMTWAEFVSKISG